MDTVPNAAFDASFPVDAEFDHPPGCYLARRLQSELPRVASCAGDFDNWRDCGWALGCEVDGRRFEVYFSGLAPGANPTLWMIGVAPVGQPGALKRLFGARPTPYLDQCRTLTREVHRILERDPHVSNLRWALNADPLESTVPDPDRLDWARNTAA
jgi:hypothetical protein